MDGVIFVESVGWFLYIKRYYVSKGFHIALAAVLLAYTWFLSELAFSASYLVFVFAGTQVVYTIHRLLAVYRDRTLIEEERYSLTVTKTNFAIATFMLLVALWALSRCPWLVHAYLALPALLTVLYVFPVFSHRKRLRDLPYVKVFVVALVWAIVTTTIPLVLIGSQANMIWMASSLVFFFIAAITLPFDIRDKQIDMRQGVSTLSTKIGVSRTRIFSLLLLGLALMVLLFMHGSEAVSFVTFCSWVLCLLASAVLILLVDEEKSDWYYSFYLDGTIMIPFLARTLFAATLN